MTAPATPDVAAAIRDLAAIIARLNLRLDAIAADVATVRAIAAAPRWRRR